LSQAVDGSVTKLQEEIFGSPDRSLEASQADLVPTGFSAVESTALALTPMSLDMPSQLVAQAGHSMKAEIERVIAAFDKELELISAKGSDAFAKRDLKGAEHMIKLAETINEYKDGLLKLKAEYDGELT
jgi:hypothetical protein